MSSQSCKNEKPVRVLIAHKNNADANALTDAAGHADRPTIIRRVAAKDSCVSMMNGFLPNVVIADYDFGIFPFINEVREANSDIPFIIISELELLQNAPKRGVNVYVLKNHLQRIPLWIDTFAAAGLFNEKPTDLAIQLAHYQQVIAARIATTGCEAKPDTQLGATAATRPPANGRPASDNLEKWTHELEQRMYRTEHKEVNHEESRPDAFLSGN